MSEAITIDIKELLEQLGIDYGRWVLYEEQWRNREQALQTKEQAAGLQESLPVKE